MGAFLGKKISIAEVRQERHRIVKIRRSAPEKEKRRGSVEKGETFKGPESLWAIEVLLGKIRLYHGGPIGVGLGKCGGGKESSGTHHEPWGY